MFHKRVLDSFQERRSEDVPGARLQLVGKEERPRQNMEIAAWPELASISARRCAAFFAEAAVLVLVFGVLDFFMQHGHIEGGWVLGALLISVALLAASVATEFSARRWLGAHP